MNSTNYVKNWYIKMCQITRDYDHNTTIMSEYCISDIENSPCSGCYYGESQETK